MEAVFAALDLHYAPPVPKSGFLSRYMRSWKLRLMTSS